MKEEEKTFINLTPGRGGHREPEPNPASPRDSSAECFQGRFKGNLTHRQGVELNCCMHPRNETTLNGTEHSKYK